MEPSDERETNGFEEKTEYVISLLLVEFTKRETARIKASEFDAVNHRIRSERCLLGLIMRHIKTNTLGSNTSNYLDTNVGFKP